MSAAVKMSDERVISAYIKALQPLEFIASTFGFHHLRWLARTGTHAQKFALRIIVTFVIIPLVALRGGINKIREE